MRCAVRGWQRLDSLTLQPGTSVWLGNVLLTQASPYPTHLVLHWQRGEKAPWFLATNLLCPQPAVKLYRLRMWIEEMFGDMKKHGFDLESSHLRQFLALVSADLVRLFVVYLAGCPRSICPGKWLDWTS